MRQDGKEKENGGGATVTIIYGWGLASGMTNGSQVTGIILKSKLICKCAVWLLEDRDSLLSSLK